jgi:hypothetical protein
MIDNQALAQKIHFPTDTSSAIFKHPQKVRRDPFPTPFSLKINVPFLITQNGESDACRGISAISPLPPHLFLYFACVYPTNPIS